MKKSLLYGAALTTLTASAYFGTGAFATEGITTGEALRDCLQDTAQAVCVLNNDVVLDVVEHRHTKANKYDSEYTFYTNLSIDIKDGRTVVVDLNGHDIAANIPINIENGNLAIINGTEEKGTISFAESRSELRTNEGWVATHADVHPQFKLTGSKDGGLAEPYSVLNLSENVEVTSANTTYSAIRINTGTADIKYVSEGNDRSYGVVVNLLGANFSDIKTYAVYVDDGANLSINGAVAENAAKINIDYGAVINATKDALVSNVYANWNIKDATIESKENVITMKGGKFVIGDEENAPKLSTEGEGKAVFNVEQSSYTDKASIEINDGVFQSTGEGGVFYSELDAKGIGEHKALGELEIKNGAFTADDLFATGTKFNQTGFIAGGTYSEWDEENDGNFVHGGYLKDISQQGDKTIMTVVEPVIEGVPEGYHLMLTRTQLGEEELASVADLLNELDKESAAFEGDGEIVPEKLEAVLVNDTTGEILSEMPEGEITLRIKLTSAPELAENFIRKWAVISSHDTEDGGTKVITFAAVLDEKTNELIISGINKFSDFYAVYDDEELVDFSELIESIIRAEEKEEKKYTEESWGALQEKISEIQELMLEAEGQTKLAMQDEIDAAKEELDAAIEGLVEVAAPDTGANFITSSPAVISTAAFITTGSILALIALAIKRKIARQ